MFDGAFTDPKLSDVDGYLTVKIFFSLLVLHDQEIFKREKSPSMIGRVKIKAKNIRDSIYIDELWK